MAQCAKLQSEWNAYTKELETEHQNCLDQNKSQQPTKNNAQGAGKDPDISCSVPMCQGLHNHWRSAQSTGPQDVSSCRQKVQKKLDEQTKKIQQEEAEKRAKAEEDRERSDNEQRKQYGDYTEKYQSWQVRENHRNQQIKQLEDAAYNIEDEAQRHAALENAEKEIARIEAERKQDPPPKQSNQGPKQK